MRRGFAACFGALAVLAGIAVGRPAGAFEAWDGRLQVHGELIFSDGSFLQSLLTSPCHFAN